MAEFNIMTIREMIDRTFGDPRENTVDFNLLTAILFILARHLKILQRHVRLQLSKRYQALGMPISVTELNIYTKRKKGVSEVSLKYKGSNIISRKRSTTRQISTGKPSPSKFTTEYQKRFDDRDKDLKSGGKTSTGKSPNSKFTSKDQGYSDDRDTDYKSKSTTESSGGKPSTGKSLTSKFTSKVQGYSDDQDTDYKSKSTTESSGGKPSTGKSPTSKFTSKDQGYSDDRDTDYKSKSTTESSGGKPSTGKSPTSKFTSEDQEYSDDRDEDHISKSTRESSGGKTSTGKSPTSKFTSEDQEYFDDRDKSSGGKISTGKSTAEKTAPYKSASDKSTTKSTTDKYTSELSSAEKSTTGQSTTDKTTRKTTSKSSEDQKTSGKTSEDQESSDDQNKDQQYKSTQKSTIDTSTDKSTTEKSEPFKSSSEKSTTGKTQIPESTGDKKSTSQSTSDKATDKSTGKSSTQKSSTTTSSNKKSALEKSSSGSISIGRKHSGGIGKGKKERQIKKIGDRDDEDEEDEIVHEKLLLVSRQSSGFIGEPSVATQEQYKELAAQILNLQAALGQTDSLGLLNTLHKTTSMTDPIAAINMATRLDVAEKRLAKMMSTVTEVAKNVSGIDLKADISHITKGKAQEMEKSGTGFVSQINSDQASKFKIKGEGGTGFGFLDDSDEESVTSEPHRPIEPTTGEVTRNLANKNELRQRMKEVIDASEKTTDKRLQESALISDYTYKKLKRLDLKLVAAMNLGDAFSEIESDIEDYTGKINALDANFSSQMTLYQDRLTQMQYDLEIGLDNLAEALSRPNDDADAAYAELIIYFNNFTKDLGQMMYRQKELKTHHKSFSLDLNALLKKINELREKKFTRDELNDALSGKVGTSELNGIVAKEQFNAVLGDYVKQINDAYDTFNSKEFVWQKLITDLIRLINDRVDYKELIALQNEIQKYLDLMKHNLDEMIAIVGDIHINPNKRKLDRPGKCLSCETGVNIEVDAEILEYYISRTTIVDNESTDYMKEKGDSNICIPGKPITHPIDPRSLICRKFCGAKATVPCNLDSIVAAVGIPPPPGNVVADGKVHQPENLKSCKPCNSPNH